MLLSSPSPSSPVYLPPSPCRGHTTTSLLKHPFYIAVSFTAVPVVAATVSSAPSAPAIIGPTTIHTSGRRDAPSSFVAPTLSTFIISATATTGHESLVLQSPSVLHHAVAPRDATTTAVWPTVLPARTSSS